MKRFLILTVLTSLVLINIGCSTKMADINAQLPDLTVKPDGVYRGGYNLSGMPVKAVVDVTVQDKRLSFIKIIEHKCSPIGKKAEKIIDRIIERQSLDVDVVSGATASSKTILKAVEKALQ